MFCYIEIMQITCCIYKDFVRQLRAFLPSFCHSCACEMIIVQYFAQLRTRLLRLRLTIRDKIFQPHVMYVYYWVSFSKAVQNKLE